MFKLKTGLAKRCFSIILWLGVVPFSLQSEAAEKISVEQVKEAILNKQTQLEKVDAEAKSEYLKELAVLYIYDQDQEHAFETFVASLASIQPKKAELASDHGLYKEALALYLNSFAKAPQETAVVILDKFLPHVKNEKKAQPLGYLIALSHANLGEYVDFFEEFYKTYASYPENYLADKTHAILYIKLFERARRAEQRESFRQSIMGYLVKAETKEPHDTSIYKLQIAFCSLQEKNEIVARCLNKIIANNIIIPRSEIQFYVENAVDTHQKDLAQRFITKAYEWHPSSRIIDTAQKFLNSNF